MAAQSASVLRGAGAGGGASPGAAGEEVPEASLDAAALAVLLLLLWFGALGMGLGKEGLMAGFFWFICGRRMGWKRKAASGGGRVSF